MAIRFRLPAYAIERVAHAYSPLLEAVLSLHVLVEPKHHPLQHPWIRRMRALPAPLKRRIAAFAFVYRRHIPDVFAPSPVDELRSFEDELATLRALDEGTIALEFSRPLYDHGGRRDPEIVQNEQVRKRIVHSARLAGGSPKLATLIFEDPPALADRFANFLAEYWEAAFRDEWEALEPLLAEAISDAGRRMAGEGLYAFLHTVSPQLRFDQSREELGVDLPHQHTVDVTEERPLLLVPSFYVWPHVQVNCDEPWPLSVIYPAPFVAVSSRPPLPSSELVGVLRALGEHTRLRALKLIAQRPRSTQELAPLLGISEAGLSKHLRQLASAGIVQSQREGYYVLYSLVPERIDALSDAVRQFVSEEPPRRAAG
jgi:DNA-binding transcriptional ArsR family regulator